MTSTAENTGSDNTASKNNTRKQTKRTKTMRTRARRNSTTAENIRAVGSIVVPISVAAIGGYVTYKTKEKAKEKAIALAMSLGKRALRTGVKLSIARFVPGGFLLNRFNLL